VRPGVVEIGLILLHCLVEMPLVQDKEEVEVFTPYTAEESLANDIDFGLSWPRMRIRSKISKSESITQRPYGC
jgi:hypothetical protein